MSDYIEIKSFPPDDFNCKQHQGSGFLLAVELSPHGFLRKIPDIRYPIFCYCDIIHREFSEIADAAAYRTLKEEGIFGGGQ